MIFGLFLCLSAAAIDGDTLRCANIDPAVRLTGIDAPELPGHCRRGRDCAPVDPFIPRDVLTYLLGQLDDKRVWCLQVDADPRTRKFDEADRWGRPVANCSVDGKSLSASLLGFGLVRAWP